jgi:hypothetical protein
VNKRVLQLAAWLVCLIALAAVVVQVFNSGLGVANICRSLFVNVLFVVLPLVLGALVFHYNKRVVVRWLLIAFFAHNLYVWSWCFARDIACIPYDDFGVALMAMFNIAVMVLILLLWLGINLWEISTAELNS